MIRIKINYRSQMSSSDGQTNGEWHSILVVRSSGITDALDDKYQDEGDQGLNYDGLSKGNQGIHCGHSQVANECGGSCYLEWDNRWNGMEC